MESEDSGSEDVVITRTETAEEAEEGEEGKGQTSDLQRAIYNSMLPVQTNAVTGLGAAAAVPELLVEVGAHMQRIRDESGDLATDTTYAMVKWEAGDSIVTVQKTQYESISQKTVSEDSVRMLFDGVTTIKCSPYADGVNAMILVCKNASGAEHAVKIAYHTNQCVCVTLLAGTMVKNVWETPQGWVPQTCNNRGDMCTVTGFQKIKLGLHDTFSITHIPKNMFPEGGALKRSRGPEGGVGGSA